MSTTYTLVSWGITLALVIGAIHVFRPDLTQRFLNSNAPSQAPPTSVTTKSGTKQQKPKKPQIVKDIKEAVEQAINGDQTSSKEARASKKRKITAPIGDKVTATATDGQKKELPRDVDHSLEDSDFAAQLKKAQAGTNLQSKSQQKSSGSAGRHVSTLQPTKSEDMLSNTERSSTTGQDADDDMSSVESATPQLASSGRDISDMLDAPTAAPTTLRLTNVSSEQKKPKQSAKQFEPVQSKKKRNEQKRREDQKRENEESNRLWEQKKQEQLRTARMAAGTSNQTKANAFIGTANAWQNKSQETQNAQNTASAAASFLDTFDSTGSKQTAETGQSASRSNDTNKPATSFYASTLAPQTGSNTAAAPAASRQGQQPESDWSEQMSEQDQMQQLRKQQDDDAWESVTTKKSKKTRRLENDTSSETSSVPPPVRARVPHVQTNGVKTNGTAKAKESMNRFESMQALNTGGLQDDEWEA